ncbi:hypothetical protein [uncultured Zobellia sp.]|uniref:hypothetical protein n=1 Tax=uncultured Zobellia sp. TaxID=255433 RepID=UPI00259AE915|nr:hypothetical protein [uncultured Zobellia sp.]
MKKLGILVFGLLLLTNCVKEKDTVNKKFNPFQNNDGLKSQFFDLDTIGWKEVVGKKGTIIYYNRDYFNVDSTDKITLELREYYELSDLIKSNIRTLTNDSELLESLGVVFLEFKKNGQKINLKDNNNISIRFPLEFSGQDKIFTGKIDSIGQISWSETKSFFTVMYYNQEYGIDMPREITMDSLPHYQELWRKQDSIYQAKYGAYDRIKESVGNSVSINNLGWLNIDRYVENPSKMDFEINNPKEIDGIIIYFVYEDYNSFSSFVPNNKDHITLKRIPIVPKTSIVVVGIKGEQLFAEKLSTEKKQPIKLKLKKISRSELVKLFEK